MTNRPDVCGGHLLPKPIPRDPEKALEDVPEQFQNETYFWGPLDHKSAEKVLNGLPAGSFLIRQSSSPAPAAFYTLSVRFNGLTKHFKLFYSTDSGEFSLGKQLKRFPTVDGLVEDGLLNYHLEQVFRREKEQQEQRQEKEQKAIEDNNKNLLLIKKESVAEHRKHDFKANTFRGLNWCEVCAQFLWGFPVQGVKCENCSFVAHKKCSESVANKECFPPNGDKAGAIKGPHFGVELAVVSKQTNSIPFIVTKCVEEVEARGIMQEGIYRVSGFADEVDELKAAFEKCGPQTNISTETLNIHTVAGVLKMFFRQLPTPLISAEVTETLLKQLNLKHNDLVAVVRTNLLKLPAAHWSCLKYMTNHLKKVSKYHETNKMNETNLATVFAPTLIGTDLNQFTDLAQEIHLLTLIIRECDQLFTS